MHLPYFTAYNTFTLTLTLIYEKHHKIWKFFSVIHSDTSTVGSIMLGHQSDDKIFFFSGLIKHGMDTHDDSL